MGQAGEHSHILAFTLGNLDHRSHSKRADEVNLASYDYGGAIRESRLLTSKYDELKRQGLFLRSSPEFLKTDWIGDTNTTIPGVTLQGSEAYITLLRNPDTGTGFIIARQNDSTSTYVGLRYNLEAFLISLQGID